MSIVNSKKKDSTIRETMRLLEKYPSDIEPNDGRGFICPRKLDAYFNPDLYLEPIHLAVLGAICYYSSYLHEKKYIRSPRIFANSISRILNGVGARNREHKKVVEAINWLNNSPLISIDWVDEESFKFELELVSGYMLISESEFERITMGVKENGITNTHKFIALYLLINAAIYKNRGDMSYVFRWKVELLAEKLNVSDKTVYRMLKKMGQLNYIARYNYLVNSEKMRTKIAISNYHERSMLRRAMQSEFENNKGSVFKIMDTNEKETI